MNSISVGHLLDKHVEAAGVYAGESSHGSQRGQNQDLAAHGASKSETGQAVQIRTEKIIDLYADVTRHLPCLQHLVRTVVHDQ